MLHGGIERLGRMVLSGDCPDETLVEGAAGTGKSFGICALLVGLCERYPGIRVLMLRKTLRSMRDTILVTLEEHAIPPGHPCLRASNRHSQHPHYVFPNGSEIVTGGCSGPDDIERIKSAEYDVIYVNEGTELTLNDYEIAKSRLRHFKLPLGNFAIVDCNPGAPTHWLNKRAKEGPMVRVRTQHEDNPLLFDRRGSLTEQGKKYMATLDALTGVRYRRLRLGEWVAAEGAIWPNFSEDLHIINAVPRNEQGDVVTEWFFGSMDWGYRDPGVLQIWGVDNRRNAYLIREVYRVEKDIDWWAEQVADADSTYGLRCIVGDPSRPEYIATINKMAARTHGGKRRIRKDDNWCIAARNDFQAGVSLVRSRLDVNPATGKPKLFILRDALRERDSLLDEARRPCGLIEEIPGYEYREVKDGQPVKEEAAPDSDDHGCDAMRYAVMYLEQSTYVPQERDTPPKTGTYEDWLDMRKTDQEIAQGLYL